MISKEVKKAVFEIRKYRIGFDIWGLFVFLLIMIPNFLWFLVPAPNDILRNESITHTVDMIASFFQIVMVAALCIIVNSHCQKPMKRGFRLGITVAVILYFAGWVLYYVGFINAVVIMDLCIAPCIAFILFSIARKNAAAFLSSLIFMGCHVIYGMINFIV